MIAVSKLVNLKQGCSTSGPSAKCGPWSHSTWPAGRSDGHMQSSSTYQTPKPHTAGHSQVMPPPLHLNWGWITPLPTTGLGWGQVIPLSPHQGQDMLPFPLQGWIRPELPCTPLHMARWCSLHLGTRLRTLVESGPETIGPLPI